MTVIDEAVREVFMGHIAKASAATFDAETHERFMAALEDESRRPVPRMPPAASEDDGLDDLARRLYAASLRDLRKAAIDDARDKATLLLFCAERRDEGAWAADGDADPDAEGEAFMAKVARYRAGHHGHGLTLGERAIVARASEAVDYVMGDIERAQEAGGDLIDGLSYWLEHEGFEFRVCRS